MVCKAKKRFNKQLHNGRLIFSKKCQKITFSVFTALLLSTVFLAVAIQALDYDSLDSEVLERLSVRNGASNIIRSMEFSILKFLAKLVDKFDEAVDIIMHLNLYDILGNNFDIDTRPLAWAIASFCVIIVGIMLMTHSDKLKISDAVRNIILALTIIVAMPSFLSALEDLRQTGLDSVDNISVTTNTTNSEGLSFGLGDQLLSDNIVVFSPSANDGQLHYYSEVLERYPESIYHLNINGIMDNSIWDKVPSGIDSTDGGQTRYSDLTDENMMDLLGMRSDYLLYTDVVAQNASRDSDNQIYINVYDTSQPYDYIQDGMPHWNGTDMTQDEYRDYILRNIANLPDVQDAGLSDAVLSAGTISGALDIIRDTVIRQRNIQRNSVVQSTTTTYYFRNLVTQEEYEAMSVTERLGMKITTLGYPTEYLYAYDLSFCYTFVMLVLTGVCLIFAGFKLGSMLFDILFMSIISYVVAATDLTGSGRAKKIVQELISTYAIFIVVALLLKIYLIVMKGIYTNIDNVIVQIILILAGAKFVIDGPDIIVKLTGNDAGVKSGLAVIQGLRTANSVIQGAGHAVKSVAGTAMSAPSKIAGAAGSAYAGVKNIKEAEGVGGKLGAMAGNTSVGQAFKSSANDKARNNDSFSELKGGSGSQQENNSNNSNNGNDGKDGKDGASGSDGLNGTNGQRGQNGADGTGTTGASGKDGNDGKDGKDGKDGMNGADGVAGEKGFDGQGIKGDNGSQGEHGEHGEKGEKGDNSESVRADSGDNSHSSRDSDSSSNSSNASGSSSSQSGQGFSFADTQKVAESNTTSFASEEQKKENSKEALVDNHSERGNKKWD